MTKRKTKKIIATLLLVSVILYFCFALIHKHNCNHNDDCIVCQLIFKIKKDIDGLTPTDHEYVAIIIILFNIIDCYYNKLLLNKNKNTLIGMKVELLN